MQFNTVKRNIVLMIDRIEIAKKIIAEFGGVKKTSKLCELAPSSVSDWKRKGMPLSWIKYFQTLRPDLFVEDEVLDQIASAN